MSQGLIQGSMREAPLPDIIQLVGQSGKTGCFHVIDEPKRAKLFLKDGRLIHAVSHDAEGLEAVYEVALWLDGRYTFEEVEVTAEPSITKSNAAVLMEMHRRMDEWRVISQKIASLDLYPASTLLPGEQVRGVNPRQARMLGFLVGWYNIAELAEVMKKPVLTVAKELYELVMTGYVVMKGVRSGKRPELPPEFLPKPVNVPKGATITATHATSSTSAPTQAPVAKAIPAQTPAPVPPPPVPKASTSLPVPLPPLPVVPAARPVESAAAPVAPVSPVLPKVEALKVDVPKREAPVLDDPTVVTPPVPAQLTPPKPAPAPVPMSHDSLPGSLPTLTQSPVMPGTPAVPARGMGAVPQAPKAAAAANTPKPLPIAPGSPLISDPVKIQKLIVFSQRVASTAERALPPHLSPMIENCLTEAIKQVSSGGGSDAVKNLALGISRGAVEAGCDADTVKILNGQLKALFSKPN